MKVIEFKRNDGSVNECLENAKAENCEEILIIGKNPDGDIFYNYHFDRVGDAYWALQVVRRAIEDEYFDPFD